MDGKVSILINNLFKKMIRSIVLKRIHPLDTFKSKYEVDEAYNSTQVIKLLKRKIVINFNVK